MLQIPIQTINYYIDIINIDTNKIKENLVNNTLTMYSIYILSYRPFRHLFLREDRR